MIIDLFADEFEKFTFILFQSLLLTELNSLSYARELSTLFVLGTSYSLKIWWYSSFIQLLHTWRTCLSWWIYKWLLMLVIFFHIHISYTQLYISQMSPFYVLHACRIIYQKNSILGLICNCFLFFHKWVWLMIFLVLTILFL